MNALGESQHEVRADKIPEEVEVNGYSVDRYSKVLGGSNCC